MDVYQVIQAYARIPAGTLLQLSDSQVSVRHRQVRALAGGWYMALADLTFKAGDVLTFCHPLDAAMLPAFLPPELQMPRACHPNQRPKLKKEK